MGISSIGLKLLESNAVPVSFADTKVIRFSYSHLA